MQSCSHYLRETLSLIQSPYGSSETTYAVKSGYSTQLQAGQTARLNELKIIQTNQNSLDVKIRKLSTRLMTFEVNMAPLLQLQTDVESFKAFTNQLAARVKTLPSQCDNFESQSRRSNLIFFY